MENQLEGIPGFPSAEGLVLSGEDENGLGRLPQALVRYIPKSVREGSRRKASAIESLVSPRNTGPRSETSRQSKRNRPQSGVNKPKKKSRSQKISLATDTMLTVNDQGLKKLERQLARKGTTKQLESMYKMLEKLVTARTLANMSGSAHQTKGKSRGNTP
jgi:hypothetical protein